MEQFGGALVLYAFGQTLMSNSSTAYTADINNVEIRSQGLSLLRSGGLIHELVCQMSCLSDALLIHRYSAMEVTVSGGAMEKRGRREETSAPLSQRRRNIDMV